MDDLSAIESFEIPRVDPHWRNGVETGFIITLGKPYYWEAQSIKEKLFFIGSLIKIYDKYTGGKIPKLTGFDPLELKKLESHRSFKSASGDKEPVDAPETKPP